MKKMFLILAMLIFASQAMAGTVTLTINQDMNDQPARIGELRYSSASDISGFGLKITADNGATIASVTADHNGVSSTANGKGFGIFPESFATYLDAQSPDWGDANYTPVAPNSAPGAAGTGIGTSSVILEMGALYEDNNEPNLAGRLCVFTVSADCNVSVTADSTRGNVVLADTTEASLVLTGGTLVRIEDEPVCPNTVPACWSYTGQCHGGADNNLTVNVDDFIIFKDSWNKVKDVDAAYDPCADFNRSGAVNVDDFIIFKDNWNKSVSGDCPTGDINGVYCPL